MPVESRGRVSGRSAVGEAGGQGSSCRAIGEQRGDGRPDIGAGEVDSRLTDAESMLWVETADGESMLWEEADGLRSDSSGLNTSKQALTARKLHTIGTSGLEASATR